MAENRNKKVAASWDAYWSGTHSGEALVDGGVDHPQLREFWEMSFEKYAGSANRLVDVASGNGAVLDAYFSTGQQRGAHIACVDFSSHAIAMLCQKYSGVLGIVADAMRLPVQSKSADLVTSQFGIEYAGLDAFQEAARIVRPGGRVAIVAHHKSGPIFEECNASLLAVREMQSCRFIDYSIEVFETGYASLSGAGRGSYDRATKKLAGAYRVLEQLFTQFGVHVAGNTLSKLYKDVDAIHQKMERYDSREILAWLRRMSVELEAYAERMASMCVAALDETQFHSVCECYGSAGFVFDDQQVIEHSQSDLPLAWVFSASRNRV